MEETTKSESAVAAVPVTTPTENKNNEKTKESIMADSTTRNIFNAHPHGADGMLGGAGGGLVGGLGGFLLGALLGRGGGLFGGNAEGTNQITQQMLSQDLGDIKADVATSALETQKAVAASNMDINATLFNQSGLIQSQLANAALNSANTAAHTNQYLAQGFANTKDAVDAGFMSAKDAIVNGTITGLQSSNAIMGAAAANHAAIEKTAAELAIGVERAGAAGVAATMAASNASALQNAALQGLIDRNAYVLSDKISSDGEKTRDLISRINEDTLNRQLATAQAEIIELRNEGRLNSRTREVEVNVNQNMNNAIAQSQSQAQLQSLANAVGILANEVQRNSQSIVNLGTMSSGAGQQSAANTKVY